MEIIAGGQPFSFNYAAYDQSTALFVAFNIYDVSTGTSVFLSQVISTYSAFGIYMGGYSPQPGKSYLIIGVVYTDNTYATPNLNYSPSAEFYQVPASGVTFLPFGYGTYDQNAAIFVKASVYDMSTGSPVFVQAVSTAYVAFGVYFGHFTGTLGKTYQIAEIVYTDNTYTTVDTSRSPGCDDFDCIALTAGTVNNYFQATLIGQSLSATLIGS